MKKFLIVLSLFATLSAMAEIDEATMKSTEPKAGEVDAARSCFQELDLAASTSPALGSVDFMVAARSCFQELETFGCRHPREDLEQFKSCMENIYSSLTPACQSRIGELYGKKK